MRLFVWRFAALHLQHKTVLRWCTAGRCCFEPYFAALATSVRSAASMSVVADIDARADAPVKRSCSIWAQTCIAQPSMYQHELR